MSATKAGDLMTVHEAAKLLKISSVTIKRWLKQGRLRAYHVGPRAVRIKQEDIEALLTPTTGATQATPVTRGTERRTERTADKEVSMTMPTKNNEHHRMYRPQAPQAAEVARRQQLVATIRVRREERVIAPMTAAQLIQAAREEQNGEGDGNGKGAQEGRHATE